MVVRIFVLLLLAVMTPASLWGQANIQQPKNKYTLGVVPQFDSLRLREIWKPILKEVTRKTGVQFLMRGSPTIPIFEREFLSGDFDFIYFNPFHILLASKAQGYIPLVNDKDKNLHGVLVVRKDSPIKSVKELEGKAIAFPAPNAMGASLMIRAAIERVFKIKFQPKYVQTHSSVYVNVALKEVSAGGGVQKTLEQQELDIRNNLRVLYRTEGVPSHPFAAHPRVPLEVREKVRKAFLEMGKTDQGKALLRKVPIARVGRVSMEDFSSVEGLGCLTSAQSGPKELKS
jgi:phosphonate transport system substrate-binding protein